MAAYTTTSLSSITQYGITVTFTEARPCWQYPNGDWGVQRPVTIAGYTPAAGNDGTYDYHGAMLNPVPANGSNELAPKQGLQDGPYLTAADGLDYDPALNFGLSLPYTIPADASAIFVAGRDSWAPENTYFGEIMVLTCLTTVPESGSFRPPYAGASKTIPSTWNIADINWAAFNTDPIPFTNDWPVLADLIDATYRPVMEMNPSAAQTNNAFKAAKDSPREGWYRRRAYGAGEIAAVANDAGYLLNANYTQAQKQQLMYNVIQWGIDLYGVISAGAYFVGNGGQNCGRRIPFAIAAVALDDALMLAQLDGDEQNWNEDFTHFFVGDSQINATPNTINYAGYTADPRYPNPVTLQPYTEGMRGMADWGFNSWEFNNQTPQMNLAPNNFGTPEYDPTQVWVGYNFGYRATNAGADIPACYILQRMGLRAACNKEAFFQYIFDRAVPNYLSGFGETINALWERDMQSAAPVVTNRPSGYYESGVTISASTPTLGATIRFTDDGITTPTESVGTTYSGAVEVLTTTTLKFVPFAEGLPPGEVTTVVATIVSPPAPPRITI